MIRRGRDTRRRNHRKKAKTRSIKRCSLHPISSFPPNFLLHFIILVLTSPPFIEALFCYPFPLFFLSFFSLFFLLLLIFLSPFSVFTSFSLLIYSIEKMINDHLIHGTFHERRDGLFYSLINAENEEKDGKEDMKETKEKKESERKK